VSNKLENSIIIKHLDILILILIDLLLAIDFTRFGNIYTIDNNIFPYYNYIVSYKYLIYSLYGYNPWIGAISSFGLGNFLVNFPVFLFSNLSFSDTLFEFSLLLLGSIPLYKLIREILYFPNESPTLSIIAGYIGVIFYTINPQGAGGLNSSSLTSIYSYALLPLLLYSIRKYFISDNFSKSLFWFFIVIPILLMIYYYAIPVYVLPIAILLFTFFLFYAIKSLIFHHYFRVIPILSIIIGFIYIKFPELMSIYQAFDNPSFIKLSYYYWVSNSCGESLELTLRGFNANFGLPPIYVYYTSFLIPLIYLFTLFNKNTNRRVEAIFMVIEVLLFTFLYSMPNVPFSSFWEKLFFEFPIMTDLRTQYVIIAPFQGLVMSIAFGLGSYALLKSLSYRKIYKIISILLISISILGVSFNVLAYGSPNAVHVPQEFLDVSNFINKNSSYNSSVLVLPIFGTENSESWYHGPSLFPLFLKPFPILGGYYYSLSSNTFNVINNVYYRIYNGNITNESVNYVKNFFYIFNVRYIIVEKDATTFGPLVMFPSGYSYNKLEGGVQNFSNINALKLSYKNSLYAVYDTNIKSSLAFISKGNYSLDYLMSSNNLTKILIPVSVKYISPTQYILKINEVNSTMFLYFMIPYSTGWNISGAKVISQSDYYGYNLFEIRPNNNTIVFVNSNIDCSVNYGIKNIIMELVLPLIVALIIFIFGRRLPRIFYNKYL